MITSQGIGRYAKAHAVAFVTALSIAFASASAVSAAPVSDIQGYPILEALQAKGQTLAPDTLDWMKKWKGMNLDDSASYQFKELTGSTSINMKIEKIDSSDPKGYKSRGAYIPHNSAANPDVEIGASQLGALLGYFLSLVLIFVINKQSFGWTIRFHWPVAILLGRLTFVYAATVLSGLYPARIAARLNPIEVVHED